MFNRQYRASEKVVESLDTVSHDPVTHDTASHDQMNKALHKTVQSCDEIYYVPIFDYTINNK